MVYVIADYAVTGCKEPRTVSLSEAQTFYNAKCAAEGVKPADLGEVCYPTCICDGNFDDYLWIL